MTNNMFNRLRNCIGYEPLCNHRPDRGIYIHGFCLPLCARCTGILTGAIVASVIRLVIGAQTGSIGILLLGLAMIAPTGIDGLIEYAFGVESTNPRRLITGLLAGVGCVITEMAIRALL